MLSFFPYMCIAAAVGRTLFSVLQKTLVARIVLLFVVTCMHVNGTSNSHVSCGMWIAEDEVNGEPCIDLSSFPFLSKIALFTLSWVKHEAIESGDDQEFFTVGSPFSGRISNLGWCASLNQIATYSTQIVRSSIELI